jgi:DNA-binding CsgD family transcriptional regulator
MMLDQSLTLDHPTKVLRDRFGLTPSEARLALRLVMGESLRSAALALDISYETARTALKTVFAKTSTHRQSELVIVILRAAGFARSPTLIEEQ